LGSPEVVFGVDETLAILGGAEKRKLTEIFK
jgi:hypothetical protein